MRTAAAADTLLILGDSLSAGYQLPIESAWPTLLEKQRQKDPAWPQIINASISGDTTAQGLARLPELLKKHRPRWVLIELGANDGLRGFPVADIQLNLEKIISEIKQSGAKSLLMQVHIPPNYGRRYTDAFSAIYPTLAEQYKLPLVAFFMEQVILKTEWMQTDGIHPNALAQPFIAELMINELKPLLN